MSADAQSATTALWAQDGSSESVAAILNKIQTTDNYMFALQLGLQEIVNLAGAERGVLLIRPHDGDEIYPLVTYSGEPASSAHTIEPATLFDNWALSWSNVEPADWFSLKLETFGNVVGAIYLDQNRDFEAMPGQKRAAVEILIHQLALILVFIRENSKLLQIAKERETLLQMLSTVGQIDQRLNANLDERQILLELQETGQFLLNAEWCLIWRVNRDTDSLNLWEGTAVAGDGAASRVSVGLKNSIAGRVALTGAPALVPDVTRDAQYNEAVDVALGRETQQLICVPLRADSQVQWVIQVLNKLDGDFDELDLSLLQALATNAVTALKNARRHASQQVQAEQSAEVYSVASHGIRSPLMSILTSIEWILDSGVLNREHKAQLEDIRLKTLNLTRFATKILDLSRIETDSINPQLMPVALLPLIKRIIAGFEFRSPDHHFSLQTEGRIPPVRADETQLSIVLDHLLDNAIKYSPAGSAVTVSVGAAERQVKVSICDEGPGVSPEDLDHLFTRFYRGRQQTQTGHSLGLGLYIVRQLINAQGGEIWIESRPGAGSCFKFTIPREEMID